MTTLLLWLLSRRSAGLAVMLRRELAEARRIVPPCGPHNRREAMP